MDGTIVCTFGWFGVWLDESMNV